MLHELRVYNGASVEDFQRELLGLLGLLGKSKEAIRFVTPAPSVIVRQGYDDLVVHRWFVWLD